MNTYSRFLKKKTVENFSTSHPRLGPLSPVDLFQKCIAVILGINFQVQFNLFLFYSLLSFSMLYL